MVKTEQVVDGDTTLPYALEKQRGANELVVVFPKLRPGVVKPSLGLRHYLESVPAHRLFLGSDADQFVGPRRELRGARLAVKLTQYVATQLGVPRERVVFAGSSYGAAVGCVIGLLHGGVVLAGAPPIQMGTSVEDWAQTERLGHKAGAASFVALGEGDDTYTPVEWLDTLVPRLAAAAQHPVRIRMVTGPDDWGYDGARALVEQARGLPLVDAAIHEEVQDRHAVVARTFWELVPELLEAELGR